MKLKNKSFTCKEKVASPFTFIPQNWRKASMLS